MLPGVVLCATRRLSDPLRLELRAKVLNETVSIVQLHIFFAPSEDPVPKAGEPTIVEVRAFVPTEHV